MGGLRRAMPWTFLTMLIATCAISGLWPLSGFWSKDAILVAAAASGHNLIFWLLVAVSVMTSAYMFRLLFLAFFGEAHAAHGSTHAPAHESSPMMIAPLVVLAAASIVVGWSGSPWMHFGFQRFLAGARATEEPFHLSIAAISTLAALTGLCIAWVLYIKRQSLLAPALRQQWRWAYDASRNAYRMDAFYDRWVIQPVLRLAHDSARFDQRVIDGAVNGVGLVGWLVAQIKGWFDRCIVDGLANAIAAAVRFVGEELRRVQTGYVQHYLLALVLAISALVVWQWR